MLLGDCPHCLRVREDVLTEVSSEGLIGLDKRRKGLEGFPTEKQASGRPWRRARDQRPEKTDGGHITAPGTHAANADSFTRSGKSVTGF